MYSFVCQIGGEITSGIDGCAFTAAMLALVHIQHMLKGVRNHGSLKVQAIPRISLAYCFMGGKMMISVIKFRGSC